jgi:ceramide glucosyltransferase
MDFSILLAGAFFCSAITLHLGSIFTVMARLRRSDDLRSQLECGPGVSILRPVCGIENFIEETLRSTFCLDHCQYEILFCVADANDPVITVVRDLMEEHPKVAARLLIGNAEISSNPKLNNLAKGWNAARHEWILITDSNVLMRRDHLQCMLSAWTSDTGLVCSPPIGCAPQNFWAELECAFLNTYQARWQCFADSLGLGFTQGKSMLFRRELLDQTGGIKSLGRQIAEDAAATKIVREAGLKVRLVKAPFIQPLGRRRAGEVWYRQVRWARLRRDTFTPYFIPEIFAGAVPPALAGGLVAASVGWPIMGAIFAIAFLWYAAEAVLAWKADWPLSARSVLTWMIRDALLPILWVTAWVGNEFVWRGNTMTLANEARPS